MRTRVGKWGTSLAVRIPGPFAAEMCLGQGSPVEVTLLDGALVVSPVVEPEVTLDRLLEGVTEDGVHGEVDTGPTVG